MDQTVCFVSASGQNAFFGELLDALADALIHHGVRVERSVDCFPTIREGLVYVFVPHELLPLVMPDAHPSGPQLRRSLAICTEQPGTSWFEHDAQVALETAAAIDINRLGVRSLKKLGVDAKLLQLGYVPSWDHWQGDEESERPVDLTFQGGATDRRLRAIALCAGQLAGRRTELHLFESGVPHRADSAYFLSGERKWDILRHSKLLLNVHRSELGYFEWQRAIGAMTNGCVLLSEHSLGFEPLVPGEHFISVSSDSFDVALEASFGDEDRLTDIRSSAYAWLREQHPLSRSIEVLAETAGDVASRPIVPRGRVGNPTPRPKPMSPPTPEYERILSNRTDLDIARMALKQLLLDQHELRQAVRRLECDASGRTTESYAVERYGPQNRIRPRVSVVVTVFNYAALVDTAIASVAASDFESYELVIVDDASTDHSADAIKAALAIVPWVTATVVTRSENRGLARARNLGAEMSAGELLFILDADNSIYRKALGRLTQTMDDSGGAAFAYGIVEQFGVRGSMGLTSYLGWDPVRLRYGNYIDAMAMIRKSALLEVGGYTTESRLHGWEDFALWCAFADRGKFGVLLPEIVGRYRMALHSMISVTNIDGAAAWSLLLDRFPCLSANEYSLESA
jgi:hypothetical protein